MKWPARFETWIQRSLRIFFAIAIGLLVGQLPLDFIEFYSYDWRVTMKPAGKTSSRIVTIAVDPATMSALQNEPDSEQHRQLLNVLGQAKPLAVIYLLDPSQLVGPEREKLQLGALMANFPNLYFALNDFPGPGRSDLLRLPSPFADVRVLPGPITSDRDSFAKDQVTRRLILSYQGAPTIHSFLAETLNGIRNERDYRGLFERFGSNQLYIDYHRKGTYEAKSFVDVLQGAIAPEVFRDKIVIIGRDTLDETKDYVLTPYSRELLAMSNLELHGNIFDTVIRNSAPIRLPRLADLFITILLCILTVYIVLNLRPLQGLLLLCLSIFGFIVLSFVAFSFFGLWLPMAHPLLAMFICYYFFIPYRLIMENRRSWEYLQKNRLLTQVEELKSNFLRMMSHDLKTPLARIQGMAGVVLSDGTPLSENQYRAVMSIYESSEELSDFIGSILNLGRIESKEIKLHLKSRDINSLLSEVVNKCEFLARKKNIELRCEFEPMFSFKVDEDLIRQVLTNLIENAIKYSPEGSKILIATEELEGQAIIQVADQGIGIPNADLPRIFDKFFRSENAKSGEVAGSGLGLYLVKYFVELHKGSVEVESEPSKGSTFTVTLPMLVDVPTRSPLKEGVSHV